MSQEAQDEGRLRRYLLGELNEKEQQVLEEQLMTHDELIDLVSVVEDDLVEDYLDDALAVEERARFEGFFLSTPDRRRKLSFAMTLRRYVTTAGETSSGLAAPGLTRPVLSSPASPLRRAFSNSYLRFAAAALIVLGLGLGIWRAFFYQSEVDKGTSALALAYRRERPVEERISRLGYAPLANTRGGERTKVDEVFLNRAERILLDEVAEHPSPQAHHALGRLYLAKQKVDDALAQFEEALKDDPKNAELHSDCGAALLEIGKADRLKGEAGKSFEEFAQSNEHLTRALELNGSLVEALFNRALCKEYLFSYQEAEKDWKTYLEKDPNSKWADEARARLEALTERPSQSSQRGRDSFEDFLDACKAKDDKRTWKAAIQNRDLNGSFIESRLIDSYMNLAESRSEEAHKTLEVLSYAGEVEHKQAGDKFVADLARFYSRSTPSQRGRVSQARSLMKSARENYSKSNFDAALDLCNRAREAFVSAGDACDAAYIDYIIGNCHVGQSKAEAALSLFQTLARRYEQAQYRWLLAQTLIALSNCNQHLRDFSSAIDYTTRSLSMSEQMGDDLAVSRGRFQLGEIYRFVNDGRRALELYAGDLALAQTGYAQAIPLRVRYFSISRAFDQLDLDATAIDFQKEALGPALEASDPRMMCRSYNHLGQMLSRRGEFAEAAGSIQQAIEIGSSLKEERVRQEVTAYSFLQLGDVYKRAGDFDQALENYDRAIQSYDEIGSKFFGFTARKNRLLCCLESRGCPTAKQQLEAVLSLFEDQRAGIVEESNRYTFFDGEQNIYDAAIEFEYYEEGNQKQAFEYSERSRGRSLEDVITTDETMRTSGGPDLKINRNSQPMSVEEIQARMPEKSQILQYAVLKKSILIWVLTKDGLAPASQTVSIEDLNKRVSNFRQLVNDGSGGDFESLSREAIYLYQLLIKPVEDKIDSNKVLCIVPDKILNYVPFGALISTAGDSRKYFVEQQDFLISPSSDVFVRCSEFARNKESAQIERITSVGDPTFDHKEFPHLGDLPAAAREARTIVGFYGSEPAIVGAAATKKRVMSEMEKSDVVHLAMHAITDEWNPMRSKLLLAADGSHSEDDVVLRASEINKLNLQRVKLVVLSACRTGVERYYGGEGMIGLARPFIAKRIPMVVASLWPVNSKATAPLMINFHGLRKTENMPTAQALCKAQREMILSPNNNDRWPGNWASFVTIGGYASF